MTGIDHLLARFPGLARADIERWIECDWVRPDGSAGAWVFAEIDIERVGLIHLLRDELDVNEAALPVVLSLLDQLYALRRELRSLRP